MNTFLARLGFGFMLACFMGGLTGCADHPIHAMTKPSNADFSITFNGAPQPTGMSITPDEGDAWLQVVKTPGPKDNKVVWQSGEEFKIKFVQICDTTQPLPAGKELGDEKKDWNAAKRSNGVWEYTLNLKQGSGHGKETVAAKYFVKHVGSGVEFDPVIIVGR